MRNIFSKFALTVGFALAMAFTFSCSSDDKDGDTPDLASFSGIWNASGGRSVVFTGNTFNYKVNGITQYSGTFSVSSSTITFNATGLGTASGNFTLSAETLVLSNNSWDSSVDGTYTKEGGGGNGGGSALNGTWSRNNGSYAFTISGNDWVYAENGHEYSKGTLSTNVTPTVPSTGTVTLTVTNVISGGSWVNLPAQYESVKTNSATFTINATGNEMVISNATLTTSGVWGTLQGTYTKEGGGN
jgi:hypothetical protein